jgi:hypothetical protein
MLTLTNFLDLIGARVFTEAVTAARVVPNDRSTGSWEAILSAAEQSLPGHGIYAVPNRQIREAAGQGDSTAGCYHFGTRTDLLRAIESKHRVPLEELPRPMLAEIGDSTKLRD